MTKTFITNAFKEPCSFRYQIWKLFAWHLHFTLLYFGRGLPSIIMSMSAFFRLSNTLFHHRHRPAYRVGPSQHHHLPDPEHHLQDHHQHWHSKSRSAGDLRHANPAPKHEFYRISRRRILGSVYKAEQEAEMEERELAQRARVLLSKAKDEDYVDVPSDEGIYLATESSSSDNNSTTRIKKNPLFRQSSADPSSKGAK